MLLDKGYIKHILNCKTMKFEIAKGHTISTMVNLDHRYFHNTDENILQKIASGKSVMEEDFAWDERKGEICFGLYEAGKPPTLISPRPRIEVKRIKEGNEVIENEQYDDSMNEFFYTIEEEKNFKKPTIYRLTFTYYKRFLWFKWIFSPEQNYVNEKNLACYIRDAFKTESKEEIETFKSFCIECDKSA